MALHVSPDPYQLKNITAAATAESVPQYQIPNFVNNASLRIQHGMLTLYPDHLLPPNATHLERSLTASTKSLTALRSDIDRVWHWDTCPTNLLPWLAWAMSVDLWDEAWPEETKRNIIRESFYLHQKKGTLYAIDRYITYAGGTLLRAITPPDKAYAGASMTAAERQGWLDRFSQIRIFNYRDRGWATYGAYSNSGYKMPILATSAGPDNNPTLRKGLFFPAVTDAWIRYGRRAFLWDKGTHPLATGTEFQLGWIMETRVKDQQDVYAFEQVRINGVFVTAFFAGSNARGNVGRKDGRWFTVEDGNAAKRIATVSILRNYQNFADTQRYYYAVPPSLTPIEVFPELVAEHGWSKLGINIFAGMAGRWLDMSTTPPSRKYVKGFLLGYLPETTSPLRLYDRIYLHEKARLPDGRPPSSYLGNMRLGMPRYHAMLSPQITGRRTIYQFGRFVYGYVSASDKKPLRMVRNAVVQSMGLRDKILLKTNIHRPLRTSDFKKTTDNMRTDSLVVDP